MLTTLALCFLTFLSTAQINTPAASSHCKAEYTVGLTKVSLDYSRPNVRGRELFVDVEKWGQMWRTGANAATKMTFSDDVTVGGQKVPKGTYAIYSIPGKESFTIMFNSDMTIGGNVSKYNKETEVARFDAPTNMMPEGVSVESFTIDVGDVMKNEATISIMWGPYWIPFKLETEVDSRVMKDIENAMSGPSRGEYYTAARYYYDNDKDMAQALTWIKAANKIDKKYWQMRLQGQIQAKLGMYKEAIASAKESSALATEAGNAGYAERNNVVIAEWAAKMKG